MWLRLALPRVVGIRVGILLLYRFPLVGVGIRVGILLLCRFPLVGVGIRVGILLLCRFPLVGVGIRVGILLLCRFPLVGVGTPLVHNGLCGSSSHPVDKFCHSNIPSNISHISSHMLWVLHRHRTFSAPIVSRLSLPCLPTWQTLPRNHSFLPCPS